MIEETSSRAFDALLSYGIAGIFSFAFLAGTFWVLKFGMGEVKNQFDRLHVEIAELNQRVMGLSVLVGKLEENVITLLKERNRQ
jgi:hypothetical protein